MPDFVQVAPDSTGKKVQCILNGDIETQAVVLVDQTGAVLATIPISALSLPLPTGAATAANQGTANTSLAAIQASVAAATPAGSNLIGKVSLVQAVDSAAYTPSAFSNLGANATLNVKASAGRVFSLSCFNNNAASRYIQLHNTTTTPAGGAAPVHSFLVPTGSQIVIGADFFTNEGIGFGTGIAFAFSTTRNTYTAATAGDQSTFVNYK